MSELQSEFDKKISKTVDKLVGEKDELLNAIVKLTLKNDKMTPEIERFIIEAREQHLFNAKSYLEEMTMTMDDKGNIIPLENISTKNIEDGDNKT